jgi:hypothetical protein
MHAKRASAGGNWVRTKTICAKKAVRDIQEQQNNKLKKEKREKKRGTEAHAHIPALALTACSCLRENIDGEFRP